ncbi:hypothetical protein Pelo_16494 [Pelomyxa schiedti]|nr:hypothetical protein Pelo_16494 [Pelomyxa schiedti]
MHPERTPGSYRLYNADTSEYIHTFREGSTIDPAGPDCICERTATGTHNILHIKSLDTPLYSLPSTTTAVSTDPLSGVMTIETTTADLSLTFQDAVTGSVLAVFSAPQIMGDRYSSSRSAPPHLDVVIDAKSQFVALACAASPVNSIENRDDVTTALRRSRSRNNIRAGPCDAHAVAVVGSLMRHIGENHVVRAHRHMVMSLPVTSSRDDDGDCYCEPREREEALHVWFGVSPTLGVVHSHVVVTPLKHRLLSPMDVCRRAGDGVGVGDGGGGGGGKEERGFLFADYSSFDSVLRVLDDCGKAQGAAIPMGGVFVACNAKWIVIGFWDHIKILNTHAHRRVVPTPCETEASEDNGGLGFVSVPVSSEVWYMEGIFHADREDKILLLHGECTERACLVDLNASFETRSLIVLTHVWIPSSRLQYVSCPGEIFIIQPESTPEPYLVYNADTEECLHQFPEGSTIVPAGPDCICETTTTGTRNLFHIKSLDTPLYSLPSTTKSVHPCDLSGVMTTTTTEPTPGLMSLTFQDSVTGSVLAVLHAPRMCVWAPHYETKSASKETTFEGDEENS